MQLFPFAQCLTPKVVVTCIQFRHCYPVLVHSYDLPPEAKVGMRVSVTVTKADISVEEWIKLYHHILLPWVDYYR